MNNSKIQEIRSVEQLRALKREVALTLLLRRLPPVRFSIAGLPERGNREANERSARYQAECGCFAGGLLMGSYVITFIVLFIVEGQNPLGSGIAGALLCFALLVGSTLAGKALGLLWARVRMAQLVWRLARCAENAHHIAV